MRLARLAIVPFMALCATAISAEEFGNIDLEQVAADATRSMIEDSKVPDSPGTGPYRPIKHVVDSLPDQVVYQPADLDALGDHAMPIYIFGNGACSEDAASSRHHLLEIASHGYLAIAPGGIFSGPGVEVGPESFEKHREKTTHTQLGEAIDWAIAENARPGSPYYGKVATDKVAISGYSCGGVQALKYAGDPRIATFVVMYSGILPPETLMPGEMMAEKSLLDRLNVPTLYILGGPSDIAYGNGMDDFSRIRNAPVAVINTDVGHGGTYSEPNGGRAAEATLAWLNWQLYGDAAAGEWFTGENCRLCSDPLWTIEWRNSEGS